MSTFQAIDPSDSFSATRVKMSLSENLNATVSMTEGGVGTFYPRILNICRSCASVRSVSSPISHSG